MRNATKAKAYAKRKRHRTNQAKRNGMPLIGRQRRVIRVRGRTLARLKLGKA